MELRQVKEKMKELGLDRHYNPVVKKGIILENLEETKAFAIELIKYGMKTAGICYRADFFILNSDGTYTVIFNDFDGVGVTKKMDEGSAKELAKLIKDEDCVIIYETKNNHYALVAQN